MSLEKLKGYRSGRGALPASQYSWPLSGSGLENLGQNGASVSQPVPEYGADELLMRIDAVSLCYTDLKEINQGPNHPRLVGRDLKTNPVVPGPEVSMTVAAVAGLRHIPAGIKATQAAVLPGKIVIYPQILDLPLTPLAELRERHPEVYEKLGPDGAWTLEAENLFLESELP